MRHQWARFIPVLILVAALTAEGKRETIFLSFSAQDGNGIFLRDLKSEEVELLLDDEPVDVRYFGYQNVRTATAFLIENSPRTAFYKKSLPQFGRINTLDRIRYGLMDDFIGQLPENNQILIAEFYRKLTIQQPFTDDEYALSDALQRIEPNVASLDLQNIPVGRMIGRGVDLLRERPENRKVLVLFTTVIDDDSVRNLEEYRGLLQQSDIELYVISFASGQASGPGYSHSERVNRFFFRKLVGETSGRFYLSGEYVFFDEFMQDLKSRLTHAYTLGFYVESKPRRSSHRVELRIRRSRCDITHRKTLYY